MKAEGKQSYRGETPKRPTPVPPTWEVTQEKPMKTYENLGASSNQRQDKFKIVSPSRYACGHTESRASSVTLRQAREASGLSALLYSVELEVD